MNGDTLWEILLCEFSCPWIKQWKKLLHTAFLKKCIYWWWLSYNPLSEGTVISHDCTVKVMVLHSCLQITHICVCMCPWQTNTWRPHFLLPVILPASPVTESCQHCCSTSNHFATWKAKCGLHFSLFRAKFSSWEAAEIQTGIMELELTAVVKGEAKVTEKQQENNSWSHKHH